MCDVLCCVALRCVVFCCTVQYIAVLCDVVELNLDMFDEWLA